MKGDNKEQEIFGRKFLSLKQIIFCFCGSKEFLVDKTVALLVVCGLIFFSMATVSSSINVMPSNIF